MIDPVMMIIAYTLSASPTAAERYRAVIIDRVICERMKAESERRPDSYPEAPRVIVRCADIDQDPTPLPLPPRRRR